jgi:hypothetical protein
MALGDWTGQPPVVDDWTSLGKLLVGLGASLVLVGLAIWWGAHLPGFGRLPGDIRLERPGFRLYFPLGTSLLLSLGLSLAVYLFSKFR